MVVSAHSLASEAGAAVLRQGGNAIDAAVAVGYALAVVDPCCGNIGGGGFMTLHLADGRDRVVNFREMAPAAATPGMFLDQSGHALPGASVTGWRAVAIPGTVLGLDTALREYGTLSRAQVMAPAIHLAREGFVLTRPDTEMLSRMAPRLRADPAAAQVFLRPDGTPFAPGDRLAQPALADTLARIAAEGPDAFYRGAIPAAVAAAAHSGGGVIEAADFAGYTITEDAPLRCAYHDWAFLVPPPPSAGGVTLCELLGTLDGYDLRGMGYLSSQTIHVLAEAMRHAFFDRNTELGDPAFVHNPVDRLLSPAHFAAIRAAIGPRATPSQTLAAGPSPPREHTETTHFSVLDAAGNAAAVTYTVNAWYGAAVMAPGTGFLLNDEMDDFTIKPGAPNMFGLVQGTANAIAPGKRPLSSMTPTVVLRDGQVALVLGSPGGPRIITAVLEAALDVIEFGMAPQEAVDAPRLHAQWLPDALYVEPRALSPDTEAALREMGHVITQQSPWGAVELIAVGSAVRQREPVASSGNDAGLTMRMRRGRIYGAADPRRPQGAAIGE